MTLPVGRSRGIEQRIAVAVPGPKPAVVGEQARGRGRGDHVQLRLRRIGPVGDADGDDRVGAVICWCAQTLGALAARLSSAEGVGNWK